MPSHPLFESTSPEKPSLLNISFEEDPDGSLGAQLAKCDSGATEEMFVPSYAVIGKLLEGDTIAKRAGVKIGDVIVAVNGEGYRRFAPDFPDSELENLSEVLAKVNISEEEQKQKSRVVSGKAPGEVYSSILSRIKEVKADPRTHLVLSLERHGWDSRVHSWTRFLTARDGDVPAAMMLQQNHEAWRASTFPIDLTQPGLQSILKLRAISENNSGVPTVYINYGKLQELESIQSAHDVVLAFVIATEIILGKSEDPRHPKSCQMVDLTGVSITSSFRVDILKQIYAAFEPNYPETLSKMIMYPVSKTVSYMSKTLLSFVNETTQKKFIITDSLDQVCEELAWNKADVEAAGGLEAYARQHDNSGQNLVF